MAVIFRGKSVAGGVHAGEILLFPEAPIRILTLKTKYVEAEVTYFRSVLSAAKQQLEALYDIAAVRYAEQAADIFDALDIQDELQTLYTSGTVFHAFLGEKLPDWKAAASLVRKIAENYKLPYYTMSPTYSICKTHGYISGEHFKCPECGAEAEVYSRITGYYRPVQNWNEGKSQEYKNRTLYDIDNSCMKRVRTNIVTVSKEDVTVTPAPSMKYLFTTKTCPNCKIAKEMLSDEQYELVDAEENAELARKYGVMQAPTLVVVNGEDTQKYVNASNIKKYVDKK